MRFSFYSLRTGIVANLAFLIISAMLLINVVMVKFAERDLIQNKIESGRLLLRMLEKYVGYALAEKQIDLTDFGSSHYLERQFAQFAEGSGFSEALMISREGTQFFSMGSWNEGKKEALAISREALATKKVSLDFYGSAWGVIWLAHKRLNVAAPIFFDGRLIAAATISASLNPVYQTLRKSEKVILVYIFLNTIVLVLVGIYLLSRIVVKPIHTLLRITEEFKEGEPFPQLADESRNEIGHLFRSLNMMLKRLEENKKELKSHISSLEKANEEIRKAQDEIIRSEKLASVGRLATGVAHEIGNPIGIILGYLELLKKGGLTEEEENDFLNRIESEITRINDIIRQLLDFSRLTSGERRETSVHKLVSDLVDLLKPQPMMANIKIKPVFEAARDTVWADPNQLKQVFLNIIINAADAMGVEGASDDDARPKALSIKTKAAKDSIELRFADTGSGIPEEDLDHIFDPFYTTKEPGKGTGMGLSVCYRIVEGMGGTIRAESTLGKGTTLIVRIPLYEKENK